MRGTRIVVVVFRVTKATALDFTQHKLIPLTFVCWIYATHHSQVIVNLLENIVCVKVEGLSKKILNPNLTTNLPGLNVMSF